MSLTRPCGQARKIAGFCDSLLENYNNTNLDILTICKKLDLYSTNITKCQEERYSCSKSVDYTTVVEFRLNETSLHRENIFFSSPREKAIFYINWFPDIKSIQSIYNELESSDFTAKETEIFTFNKKIIDEILDNETFIKSIYKYIWACLYSYDICTLFVDKFKDFLITLVNERTRDNYIICDCNPANHGVKAIGPNESVIDEYKYTCGRALKYILKQDQNTRFIIYNTISTQDDYMDDKYMTNNHAASIVDKLKGGRIYKKIYKKINKKHKKYTVKKSKKTTNTKTKKQKIYS